MRLDILMFCIIINPYLKNKAFIVGLWVRFGYLIPYSKFGNAIINYPIEAIFCILPGTWSASRWMDDISHHCVWHAPDSRSRKFPALQARRPFFQARMSDGESVIPLKRRPSSACVFNYEAFSVSSPLNTGEGLVLISWQLLKHAAQANRQTM